jgi:hypothetical protein
MNVIVLQESKDSPAVENILQHLADEESKLKK